MIGILMFIGYYTPLFESAISPWTTLGPLAIVISVSLAQEAYTDAQRHRSDKATNYHPCVVLKRADEVDQHDHLPEVGKHKHRKRDATLNDGKDVNVKIKPQPTAAGQEMTKVPIAFESVFRMNIHAGDLVVVRNREMIPVDLILLASSNEGGSAYIETSSIDGETNLKLRNSPHLPSVRPGVTGGASNDSLFNGGQDDGIVQSKAETLKQAIQRVANMSLLGHPDGVSALLNPANTEEVPINERSNSHNKKRGWFESFWHSFFGESASTETRRVSILKEGDNSPFIATLTSEPPNTHVNNYSGKLTLPPMTPGEPSENAPLNAENILLRGAMLRNTEWVVGVACFTGADTKLVMNSVATPSKFSQLDMLINRTVVLILAIMIICVCSLGGLSLTASNKEFDNLWYAGFSANTSEPWPYFNLEGSEDIASPKWDSTTPNYLQNVFLFVTMLSNFVPLSLYVSVEIITVMMMLYVSWDLQMYHKDSDTPASARSTIVTDLGLVDYIFSDKTGTLTCNIMEFKRCSVDGHVFGMPVAKAAPADSSQPVLDKGESNISSDSVHPLKHLLAGSNSTGVKGEKLTFNAEMFLRVMSICHTVVVEKDHVTTDPEEDLTESGMKKSWPLSLSRSRANTAESNASAGSKKKEQRAAKSAAQGKKQDGAPAGYAYQAESPDEGALVSAASNEYGFQLLGRDFSGVKISCSCPSLFDDNQIVEGVKNGTLTAKMLAAQTASTSMATSKYPDKVKTVDVDASPRTETWSILAVNKFDSDRKRMSVLVRSPPELGSVPILLCKGADSSMLIEGVCEGVKQLDSVVDKDKPSDAKPETKEDDSELATLLGIQAHLGGKFVGCLLIFHLQACNLSCSNPNAFAQSLHRKGCAL